MTNEDRTTKSEITFFERMSKYSSIFNFVIVVLMLLIVGKYSLHNGRVYECRALGGTYMSDGGCANWTFDPEYSCVRVPYRNLSHNSEIGEGGKY